MNVTQRHRGPDEEDIYTEGSVGLGHTRLSIIDLADGQQPMSSADGKTTIVFNGEIYNFIALRDDLIARGHQFRTHSDTEVILASYREYGEACVDRLRGMFAFAIWDANRKTLFLARDRLGIKPLFYAETRTGQFIFGSELKSITAHPELSRQVDPRSIEDYFTLGYVPEPRTIYEHAFKLSPGHTLTVESETKQLQLRQYWDVPTREISPMSTDDACARLLDLMTEAVDIRQISEVPLGAFLSGGVDSSSVVAIMASGRDTPVTTCSMAFDEPQYNEADFARSVAERYGTNHHEEEVSAKDFDLLDELGRIYDEPYADSSAIPTYRVCELARRHVTVALSGDGGDEVLAGYRRYRWHMNEETVRRRLPSSIREPLFGALAAVYPKADWAPRFLRAKTTLQGLSRNSVDAYLHSVSLIRPPQRAALFSDDLRRQLQGYRSSEVFATHAANYQGDDPLKLIQYLDLKTYLVGDILTKVDRASMAHSLEVRVPLLDHRFLEWAMTIPSNLNLHRGEGKYILKKAMEPLLPSDVLYRTKMGFSVPISEWFRTSLKERIREVATSEAMLESGYFNMEHIGWMVDQHQRGLAEFGTPLWTLLMFDGFLRRETN